MGLRPFADATPEEVPAGYGLLREKCLKNFPTGG
jgi:hypothetical protein